MAMAIRRYFISSLSQRRLSTAAATASPPSTNATAPPRNPISRLKSSVRALSDPEKVVDLFQSSTHLPRFYDDRPLYEMSVDKLVRFKRTDLVERLLESQKSDPAAPKSEGFFIRIMSLYAQASMPDHALRTFEQIPSRTEQSICALLAAYHKQKLYDRVRELFHSVPIEHGIAAGSASYNVLLSALCSAGEVQSARKMLDEMFDDKKFKTNVVSYNTILTAYYKNGDEAGFHDVLKEMSRKEVVHNVITYNLRIMKFCRERESRKAEELLDELVLNGIQPNAKTFSTIIKGFCKEGDLDAAVRVWDRIKKTKDPNGKNSCKPTPDIYGVLISGLVGKGNFTSALPICKECLDRDFTPPFDAMKTLIQGLVKDSKPDKAKVLVEKMRKVAKGCAVDAWRKIETELPL